MKYTFLFFCVFSSLCLTAQQKLLNQAIINTTTNITSPEEEEVQNLQSNPDGGGRGMNFRNMLDGEIKFVTYIKNSLVKTNIKSETIKSTVYRDNQNKITTTIMEMMGNKMGFYISDQEMVEMGRKRDSIMAERRKSDTSSKPKNFGDRKIVSSEIAYSNETKKIAGYLCTKAYLINKNILGLKDSIAFWYTPEIKFENLFFTGGISNLPGMRNMSEGLSGIDKINGFVMGYEMTIMRNKKMEVEVTKIDTQKTIEDKEFALPKDVEIKPMKDMQFGRGGMMRGMGGRD